MKIRPLSVFFFTVFLSLFLVDIVYGGAVGGPRMKRTTVKPFDTDTYTVAFEEDETARVRVSGDGASDLDCVVFDSRGNLIDQDVGPLDECTLTWHPVWTGKFKIEIRNLGSKYNEYTIRTN